MADTLLEKRAMEAGQVAEVRAIALSAVPAGGRAVIRSLEGGHEFRSRVANLGFTIGARVKVLQNYGRGPILVSVRGSLVALGRMEAAKVLVSTAGDP